MLRWLLAFVLASMACGSPPTTVVIHREEPVVPVSPVKRSIPTVDGLYVERGTKTSFFVFSLGDRKWMSTSNGMTPLTPGSNGSWLVTFGKDEMGAIDWVEGTWRLHGDGSPRFFVQREDPIGARFTQQQVFTRVDAKESKDTIELRPPLALFHSRDKDDACSLALLEPDPSDPLPSRDALHRWTTRKLIAIQVRHGACVLDFDPSQRENKGVAGGITAFIDARGSIAGLQIVGYMMSELYLADGVSQDDAVKMLEMMP